MTLSLIYLCSQAFWLLQHFTDIKWSGGSSAPLTPGGGSEGSSLPSHLVHAVQAAINALLHDAALPVQVQSFAPFCTAGAGTVLGTILHCRCRYSPSPAPLCIAGAGTLPSPAPLCTSGADTVPPLHHSALPVQVHSPPLLHSARQVQVQFCQLYLHSCSEKHVQTVMRYC